MYHGGCFVEDPMFRYTRKFVDHHDWCRIEGMNMLELADMVFILGYRCPVKLYWKKAEDNLTRESIRQLNTDQDVLSLVDNMPRNHYLNVSNESNSLFVESDNDVGEEETCTENVTNEVDKEYCGIGLSDLGIGSRVGSDSESQNSESLNSVHESDSDGQKFPEFNSSADMIKPSYPPTYLVKDVYKDHSAVVSLTKCQRARDYALEKIMGSQKQQYVKIYDYLSELRQTNRGTTTICYLNECLFQRMYVCMQACKDGFKAGCRPIISLDGCHLKGYYGGHILAAVGIDADDCIYPIAYACVESECGQSWAWFLDILKDDLDIFNSYHISFMSDRQKGLVDAIAELFPHSEHRTCVRHLYTNFKSEDFNKEKHLKDLFLENCKINYCYRFQRHFFILEARDKPILIMMETIRTKIMQRIAKKQSQAEKFVGPLCPKIQKKLEIMIELSNRRWELTGIPCSHAIGPNQWTPQEGCVPILPPPLRRPLGRSHKSRRKEADEPASTSTKLSRKYVKLKCTKCGKPGHNIRTCKGEVGGNKRNVQRVRTTRKQVPSGQTPTEQSQTAIQPPRTILLKQPCQPRQKQPIKRKEPVVHHDSRKKQANPRHTNPSRMPSNTQDSTATTQDTPRSNVTNTKVD
ncbi:hypothetical protein V6N13_113533 [Hibiscus sabdariffa]